MESLSLFSDWKLCNHCGLPPAAVGEVENKSDKSKSLSLLSCSRCHSVAYHDVECQRAHWKAGHKNDCKKLQKAIKPLKDLMNWQHCEDGVKYTDFTSWLSVDLMAEFYSIKSSSGLWQRGVQEWNDQNYLEAMAIFQTSLVAYQNAWSGQSKQPFYTKHLRGPADEQLFCTSALHLAKRLLFCAYCELDGEQIESARQRLVQCLSLLITIQPLQCASKDEVKTTMDDAWMELTLSMEEVPSDRITARHVAKMAIITNSCGWTDAQQRPGFVAKVPLDAVPFIARENHLSWCEAIEHNWQDILKEYKSLIDNNKRDWHDVGSGERGSGHNDHRVVTGKSWTEYVLFGSGSTENNSDAPITKQLIREYVPDAVSLAEMGGGEVIFSRLEGGTFINSHCGTTNIRWTAHLGLIVPKSKSDCRVRVADEWHSWDAGKLILFDDSFEHEVINDTSEERVVLLMRLWHPQLEKKHRHDVLTSAIAKKEENVAKRYHPPI